MGQREEVERLIGEAYAQLRRREWGAFDQTISELSLYSWGMIQDVISGKAMRASLPSRLRLWYIHDAVVAFPFGLGVPASSLSSSHSPLYSELTWEWIGGFFDGEASFFTISVPRGKQFIISIGQKRREVLEEIADFIDRSLGTMGRIEHDRKRDTYLLNYGRMEDVAKLGKRILPYLHHPERREAGKDLLTSLKDWSTKRIPIELKAHRIKYADRHKRILRILDTLD